MESGEKIVAFSLILRHKPSHLTHRININCLKKDKISTNNTSMLNLFSL